MRQWSRMQAVEENQHDIVRGFEEGEDRDVRIPNFNPTQMMGQESPVKLPLTPIVSTPHSDRRGNATVSTRRGSAIFSPMQTLDHHHHHHHHHHHQQLNPPPPQHPHVLKHPILDPDPPPPPPPPTTDHDGASNSKTQASSPRPPPQPPAPPPPPANANNSTSIRYRECLKNYAASMGGHVVDGCGEFMPSGDEGTAEALRCAACDCHRNFHRKQVQGDNNPNSANININRIPLIHNQTPPSTAAAPPAMMNFGGSSGGAADESSSEDLNMTFQSSGGGHVMMQLSKKRFRTKFSQEQKERMQEFGEKLGWRIQKQDEQQVQRFCDETGVKRQIFKVWMHNNKQAMKKRQI